MTTTATTAKRYPILDDTGKVRAWLDAGRGVAVWKDEMLDRLAPDRLTPADRMIPPHWGYRLARTIHDPSDVLFYQPVGAVAFWTDSPQGWRAARRALEAHPDETHEAPIGTVHTTWTLRRVTLGSISISPEGTRLEYRLPDETPPQLLAVTFKVALIQWTAIDHAPTAEPQP